MYLLEWTKFTFKVLKANFSYPRLPFKYFLVVTKSCGSRCTNCLIWKETPNNELTLEEFKKIAMNAGPNLYWLNISGGEPTDRADLAEIIRIFIDHCPNLTIVNFTTNGLNLETLSRVATFLDSSRIPIIGINVSIDGPPDVHNKLRGMPDGFNQAIEAYKMIRNFKRIKSAPAMTLFPLNHNKIEETVLSIKKHIPLFDGSELHLNYPHSSGHYYGNGEINYSTRVNIDAITPYLKTHRRNISPMNIVERIYQKKLLRFLKTNRTPMNCAALISNIYISEKGDIYPCTIWDKKIGSLRDEQYDLKRIINSEIAKKTKDEIKQKKCPNCWTPCEAFPSIITDIKSI